MDKYVGTLSLSDGGELSYFAKIEAASLNDELLLISFQGADEGDPFTGMCRLNLVDGVFTGDGNFTMRQRTTNARITLRRSQENNLSFTGPWLDDNDNEPYDCEVELER